ncbi:GNAT family N-acetyltransferase, partial [Bacteriovoracaceae bacterium]|nr:GNAT family N-acetyltransferase [Bacteriovoracaceae bacterium]
MKFEQYLIRPLEKTELSKPVDYFLGIKDDELIGMGVDKSKLLSREDWHQLLLSDFDQRLEDKKFYYLGWYDGHELIGHSNINSTEYGEHATIHLHMWNSQNRQSGLGTFLFRESINFFLEIFKLKKIICEPAASNPAPHRVFKKLGIPVLKEYEVV